MPTRRRRACRHGLPGQPRHDRPDARLRSSDGEFARRRLRPRLRAGSAFGGGDHGSAYVERAQIYDFVANEGITGFATIAGDRHSFWAGLAAKALPPQKFEPVGIAFVTGSVSAPGLVESLEHKFPKDHPLRPLLYADPVSGSTEPPGAPYYVFEFVPKLFISFWG